MTNLPQFTHINVGFVCDSCGMAVAPLERGCRNHCPFCLSSKHVDINPGDRQNPCQGTMRAIGYSLSGKKGLVLHFRCDRCGGETNNISAYEAAVQPDDYDLILKIGSPKNRKP